MTYEHICAKRGLIAPAGLTEFLLTDFANRLNELLYRPNLESRRQALSLDWAFDLLKDSAITPPPNLLPLLPVDESSIACAVCDEADGSESSADVPVIRWHLNKVDQRFQGACLDTSAIAYVRSVAEELIERDWGLKEISRLADRYQKEYASTDRRPAGWATRPVQIACQNVIVGLAAFAHNSSFDGLRVPVYLTCEVPHLATHEANRALSALMLCDAFQNGGTMEVRFGKFGMPPALRRFGRSLGIALGTTEANVLDPVEARELFLAITPMPSELWTRVIAAMDSGLISPERLCYSLLAPVWSTIELDYLLATSARIASILEGGAPFNLRRARLAELESARAALMIGMLFRRLDNKDVAAVASGRSFEDTRVGVEWIIAEDTGVVTFAASSGGAPWTDPQREFVQIGASGLLHIIPRALPTPVDYQLAARLQETTRDAVALLVPNDMREVVPPHVPLLLCPDRLAEIDIAIARKFNASLVGRS